MPDDHPAALLTNTQREYLRGEEEPTHERPLRSRLRDRLWAGLVDFETVFFGIEDRDVERIVEEHGDDFESALISTLAFLYELGNRADLDFEHLLTEAVDNVYRQPRSRPRPAAFQGVTFEVDTNPQEQFAAAERAKKKFERGDVLGLTDYELRSLLEVGERWNAATILEKYREKAVEQRRYESRKEWAEQFKDDDSE